MCCRKEDLIVTRIFLISGALLRWGGRIFGKIVNDDNHLFSNGEYAVKHVFYVLNCMLLVFCEYVLSLTSFVETSLAY